VCFEKGRDRGYRFDRRISTDKRACVQRTISVYPVGQKRASGKLAGLVSWSRLLDPNLRLARPLGHDRQPGHADRHLRQSRLRRVHL